MKYSMNRIAKAGRTYKLIPKKYRTIRMNDPDKIIPVGSPRWDQDVHLPASDPIQGFGNLIYTLHFYAATHKQWLRDRADEAIKKGWPFLFPSAREWKPQGMVL